MSTEKSSASELINQMPEDATWDDIMYKIYVKQRIEAGILAIEEKWVTPHGEIKTRLLQRKRLAS